MKRWFEWMARLQSQDGLTARQVAAAMELDRSVCDNLLEWLVERGEVLTRKGSPVRYRAQPFAKVLPIAIREMKDRKSQTWVDFDYAVMAYREDPRQLQWSQLKEAYLALIDSFTAWPEHVALEAKSGANKWVAIAADVLPPSHLVADDEWSLLKAENAQLRSALAGLKAELEQAQGRAADHDARRRLKHVEAENARLAERVQVLEDELDDYRAAARGEDWQGFLAGEGRGELPASLSDGEVERLRSLVLHTWAAPEIQVKLAAKLLEILEAPTRFTRLTSKAFEHHS
ncbi:MAG: hypothetical protein ACLGIN_15150, partial [Candidatus Sericytochromatia bacterium]